jgi:hypothetical protein
MRRKTTSRFVHHTEKRSNSSRSASFTVARWPRRLQSGGSNRASNSGHAGRTWVLSDALDPEKCLPYSKYCLPGRVHAACTHAPAPHTRTRSCTSPS